VTRFSPGDEVFGAGVGIYAEYATSTERRLAPKPRNLTFEQAAALPIAGLTALQGLRDKGCLQPGQRVLVYGAGGGVGTFAVQIAKALGARVTAVTSTNNVELMHSIGADETIDYTKEHFSERGERYDILYDLGGDRSLADCRRALAPNGTHVLAGAAPGWWPLLTRLLEAQLRSRIGRQRVGTFMARGKHEDLVVLKELAEAGKLSPVIDRTRWRVLTPRYVGSRGPGQGRHQGRRPSAYQPAGRGVSEPDDRLRREGDPCDYPGSRAERRKRRWVQPPSVSPHGARACFSPPFWQEPSPPRSSPL
jgi:NADPH:quinone reductase-like Zn-dependent oxidoreductase